MILSILLLGGLSAAGQDHQHADRLGTVEFKNSCSAAAQPEFTRGVALLHSFEFRSAIDAFERTLTVDPACAIAYWGLAISLWSNPFAAGIRAPAVVTQGQQAVDAANSIDARTDRERAYI